MNAVLRRYRGKQSSTEMNKKMRPGPAKQDRSRERERLMGDDDGLSTRPGGSIQGASICRFKRLHATTSQKASAGGTAGGRSARGSQRGSWKRGPFA